LKDIQTNNLCFGRFSSLWRFPDAQGVKDRGTTLARAEAIETYLIELAK
jgi:hypothetical protein